MCMEAQTRHVRELFTSMAAVCALRETLLVCLFACMDACICVCMFVQNKVVCVCVCTCIRHMYIHTRAHKHTYIHVNMLPAGDLRRSTLISADDEIKDMITGVNALPVCMYVFVFVYIRMYILCVCVRMYLWKMTRSKT